MAAAGGRSREALERRLAELEQVLAERDQRLRRLVQRVRDFKAGAAAGPRGGQAPASGGNDASDDEELRKAWKPVVTLDEAAACLEEHWGIRLNQAEPLEPLESYDDVNFLVPAAAHGVPSLGPLTMKIHNGVESLPRNRKVLGCQNAVMEHLHGLGVACPVPLSKRSASAQGEGSLLALCDLNTRAGGRRLLAVRLLTFVPGETMAACGCDEELLEQAGCFLGRLSAALRTFDHAGATRTHAWDLCNTLGIRQFTKHIDDAGRRRLVEAVLDRFEQEVLPVADELDLSVIQGDFNDANVIVEHDKDGLPAINGVIDFGDMVRTWRVNEVAVGMAYAMLTTWGKQNDQKNGPQAAAALLRGVALHTELTATELRVLPVLTACRLACSFTFGMYSYSQDPTNEYLLFHASPAGRALEVWCSETPPDVLDDLLQSSVAHHYPLQCQLRHPDRRF